MSPINCGARLKRCAPFWSKGVAAKPGSDAEFRRYLSMAIGSADEARLWCDYAADLGYVPSEQSLAWQDELGQIARMLHGLRKNLSEN